MPRIIQVAGMECLPSGAAEDVTAALCRGALILVPTETVYGLAADPRRGESKARLFKAKRRPDAKPLALLVCDCAQIERWGGILGAAERGLAERYWPGPLTLVLPVRRCGPCGGSRPPSDLGMRESPASEAAFVGFRVPNQPVTLSLLKEFGAPLLATSANISGRPPALTVKSALRVLRNSVELALDAGPAPGGVPSTVVRIACGSFSILRAGAIAAGEIASACKQVGLKAHK